MGWGAGMSTSFQRDLPAPQNWCQPNLQQSPWEQFIPFLDYDVEIRRVLYSGLASTG